MIMLLTNAIFRGLDLEGKGVVKSTALLALFQDINLSVKSVIEHVQSQPQMSFAEVQQTLSQAKKEGFDIAELLSVDNVLKVGGK